MIRYKIRSWLKQDDLNYLATLNGSDKFGSHYYTQHYQKYFAHLKEKRIKLLEIGIGGWDDPNKGGASLRMWRSFFRKGNIYGIDIQDKSPHDEKRIKTLKGSQDDEAFLTKINSDYGPFDIIIDDGSHYTNHVIRSFEILFPLLKPNGIYAIEDLQTSYWPSDKEPWNGSSDLKAPHTSMNFLKGLVDGLNFQEFRHEYEPSYFDKNITAISFYHNLCFIQKGLNNEGSNII